jgi:hypothetical protein
MRHRLSPPLSSFGQDGHLSSAARQTIFPQDGSPRLTNTYLGYLPLWPIRTTESDPRGVLSSTNSHLRRSLPSDHSRRGEDATFTTRLQSSRTRE